MKAINSFFRRLGICLFLIVLIVQISLSGARGELSSNSPSGTLRDRATLMAVNPNAAAQKAEKASEKVKSEDAIKTKFGETEEGDRLIEQARDTAQNKLKNLAERSRNEGNLDSLPPNERNFLEKLHGDTND